MTAPLRAATLAALVAIPLVLVAGAPRDAATYPGGSPGGFSGSNREPNGAVRTCTTCHSSYALNSGTGGVRVDVPTAVEPGQTVAVTVTVDNRTTPAQGASRRQGFETAARTGGTTAGVFSVTDAAATRKLFNEEGVTQTIAGTTRTSWTFDWTAPDAPAEVTFYTAGNAANGGDVGNSGDNSAGDHIYTATRTVRVGATPTTEGPEAARALAIGAPHPNPARATTTIRLSLADAAPVRVRLVDGRGRTVRVAVDGRLGAGDHDVAVRTAGLAPGLYVVVAEAGGRRVGRPVVVVR